MASNSHFWDFGEELVCGALCAKLWTSHCVPFKMNFLHLVLVATGSLAQEATNVFIGHKVDCKVMSWLCCYLSFSLLRSAITCVHGVRSSIGHVYRESHLHITQ